MTTETISVTLPDIDAPRSAAAKSDARPNNGAAHGIGGMLWFAGWLFTIGYAKLVWWHALLAIPLWPYFLGAQLH